MIKFIITLWVGITLQNAIVSNRFPYFERKEVKEDEL